MEIYLDNSATTCVFEEVAQYVSTVMTSDYGNPSSMHLKGVEAEKYVKESTKNLAKILKVQEKEIFYTSGGTESDNWALIGAASANHRQGRHLITTKVEHPAVLQTMEYLSTLGYEITYLPVNEEGVISLEDLKNAIREDTILVSMMHVNNEVGAVMPIEQAGQLIKQMNPNILFHVDAVQSFGKFKILPKKWNIDMLSVSSHKIHGPKGVGMLFIDDHVKIKPIVFGGGQQKGLRSGTENVPGIAGMGMAAKILYDHLDEDVEKLYAIKERFVQKLQKLDHVMINGPKGEAGAPHIVSATFLGIRSEVLLHALEDKGVYVSAGSACATNKHTVSATLSAMGAGQDQLDSTLRFSFSVFTTDEELDYTIQCLEGLLPMLRRYTRH